LGREGTSIKEKLLCSELDSFKFNLQIDKNPFGVVILLLKVILKTNFAA
jgi:hypothetical protein